MTIDEARQALDEWVKTGIPRGDFLMACLRNDLFNAIAAVDDSGLRCRVAVVVYYIHDNLPFACWGTAERVEQWATAYRVWAQGQSDGASLVDKGAAGRAAYWLRENGGLR